MTKLLRKTRLLLMALPALAAATAWGATPVADVVWESDFNTTSKTGTDGNTYSIALNGNTVNDDGNIVIASSATTGAVVDTTAANSSAMTVLIKYAAAPAQNASKIPLSIFCDRPSGSKPDVGMVSYASNNSRCYACWCVQSNSKEYNSTDGSDPVVNSSGGYLMVSFQSSTLRVYAGRSVATLVGGAKDYAWGGSKFTYVGLGGQTGKTTGIAYNAWDGMVIEKVAIFTSNAYTNSDLADYVFPGDEANKTALAAWIDDNRSIYAWRAPATGTGNFHQSNLSVVNDDGSVNPSIAMDGTGGANYLSFASGKPKYTAPGHVLCFDKAGYKASTDASFTPLSFGGLYVNALGANNATYTITGTGTRVTELGSTDYDTYFTFNQPFALNRQGNVTIYGNATVTTGSGVTFNCNSSRTSYTTILNSGATLKLAGEGNMAVTTLNASNGTLDFSALSSRSAALPYITGTVQLGANTSIIVPEGTTSPYKIGSAVTGTYPGSITIGSKTYATTLSAGDNAGEIAWTINSATIGAAGTYTLEDLFTSTSTTGSYEIDVEESATLNVASASTIANLTLNVADGKTLTITGSDLTISGEIVLNGGTVAASSATALSGTVGGDGRFIYTAIPEGMTWTGSGWTGTLTLQDLTFENKLFSTYGNTGSTLELVGVQGYNNEMVGGSQTWVNPTVKFTDSETAGREFGFKYTGANNGSYFTFNIIAGTGKLVCVDNSTQTMRAGVYTDFSGSIDIGTHAFIFGTSSNTGDSGTITVPSGVTLAVAAGETWTASNGFVVNGTLTIEDGATASGSFSGSGTVVANKMIPPTASTFTGTLTVNAAAYPSSTDSDATAIYGASLNVASGVLKLTGNVATWPTTVNISSGAYLWIANTSMESLALKVATFEGMLYLEEASGLTRLSLDVGGNRNLSSMRLALPSSATLAMVNIAFYEAQGEGGTITLSNVSGISAVEGRTYNVTVNCLDGRTVTGTYDSSTGVVSYVPSISGSATDLDWDFTDGVNDDFEQAPSGMGKNHDDSDNTPLSFYTDADDSTQTGVYIKHHPYTTGAASWFTENSAAMTVVVVGTMPSTQNTIFLNFGSAYVNKYGLLIATTANENEVLIGYNYGGTVTPITTMTVPNASSSRHSYIVTKVDGETATTFTVYLDGTKWKTVTTDAATLGADSDVKVAFTGDSNNGIQVGSDYGGNIYKAGTYSSVNASKGDGVLNVLRAYGRVITQAEIDAYAAAFPYDSPSGKSTRTFSAASENWIDETENSAVWSNTKSGNTSGTPDVGAQLEVTASAASAQTIEVNLAAQASYESLLVEGSQTVTFELADGYTGAIAPGKTTIKTPVIVKPGVLNLSGGPTFVEGDGHLTFDYSGYTMSGTSAIELTGQMDRNDSAVAIVPPADQHYTYTYGYSGTQYVITPAVAVAVLNHNDTLTGYTTIDAAMAAAVSGDTVTLQTAYLTPGTHATYAGDKTGVNVVVQGYTIAPAVADGTTTWSTSSYIWTGAGSDNNWTTPANWGLASGYPNANDAAVTFGATANVTLSGTVSIGSMEIASGETSSIAGGQVNVYGNISGAGTLSLNGVVVYFATGAQAVSAALDAVEGSTNTLRVKQGTGDVDLTGALSGKGAIVCTIDGNRTNGGHVDFLGDTSAFEGSVTFENNGNQRASHQIAAAAATNNAKSSWALNAGTSFDGNGSSYVSYFPLRVGSTTYAFGALNGTIPYAKGSNGWLTGVTLEVGALNADCALTGDWNAVTEAGLNWVATSATMTYGVQHNAFINITGGGTVTLNNTSIMRSGAAIGFSGNGGTLKIAGSVDYDPSAFLASTGTPVVFDDDGVDRTWATAIPAAVTGGFTKKGAGTLTLAAIPAYTGATTVEAGTLVVPQGTVISELALVEGAKLAVPFTGAEENTAVITVTALASGTTQSMLEAALVGGTGVSLSVESGEFGFVVKATRTALTYNWVGATSSDWDTLSNWSVTVDNEAVAPTMPPTAADTVVFPATEEDEVNTVTLDGDKSVLTFTVNGDTRISGGCIVVMGSYSGTEKIGNNDYDAYRNDSTVSGNGTLYLGEGGGVKSRQEGVIQVVSITVPEIVIEGTSANHSYLSGWRKTKGGMATTQVHATAAVTGSGYVEIGGNRGSAWLTSAKWKDFEGHVIIFDDGQSRDNTQFESETAVASLESSNWNVPSANSNFTPNGTEYTFGELTGSPTWSSAGNSTTVNVGKLGTSFSLGGTYNNAVKLVKQGTGTMTFTGLKPGDITVEGGELRFSSQYYITNKVLAVSANATLNATEDFFVNGANGELNVSGSANVGAAGAARWLFIQQGATVNLNAGGTLSICRMTATDGAENINFNGGTLQSYGDGNGNENIIGAYGDTGAITMKVLAGGAVVDTQSFSTTITGDIQSGVQSGTDGGFTKRGAGTLTLAGTLSYTGPTTVEAGYLVMPDSTSVTFGENTIVSARDAENGTMTLAYATTVALTVPDVENATYVVTIDGEEVTGENGVFNVPVGSSSVVVTYTGVSGYTALNGVFTANINEATTLDTSVMTIASNATWTGNGTDCGWSTGGNWSTGTEPTSTTHVVFPDTSSAYTVWISNGAVCGTMQVDGDVTFAQWDDSVTDNKSLELRGNVTGTGTLTLGRAGLWNNSGSTIAFAPNLVIAEVRDGENALVDSWLSGSAIQVDGDFTVEGKCVAWNARHVFTGNVTLSQGAYMGSWSDLGFAFNGATVTGEGTGAEVWIGNSNVANSDPDIAGTGVTFAGRVNITSTNGTKMSAPVKLLSNAVLVTVTGGTVTGVTTDIPGHEVVESPAGTYTCQWSASAVPAIGSATVTTSGTDGVKLKFAVSESSLIEGLYYRVKAVDGKGKESDYASTDPVQYDGSNYGDLNFTAPLPQTDGVLYYTIEASDVE